MLHLQRRLNGFATAVGMVAVAACAGGERAERDADMITVADVGFETPESVLHDTQADVYLVTNINGSPLAKDDNGFISQVSPGGGVIALRWIDGATTEVTLHAPKGMALKGDTLFVTDIDVVRMFHRTSGSPLGARTVPGATFLNDLAVGSDGRVYVTDSGFKAGAQGFEPSGTDAVHFFDESGAAVALVRGQALGGPNGIVIDGTRALVVAFGSGSVTSVNTGMGTVSGVPAPPNGQLDGIVKVDDGVFLISSWEGQAIYRMGGGGQYEVVADSLEAPADIGYDARRQRVLVPLFMANTVVILRVP